MADRTEMTIAEFHAAIKAQGVSSVNHAAFICPACGTIQSMADHVRAGATLDEAERAIAFSCIGRRTGAKPPRRKPDGQPCNWTLGGFLQIHDLTVIDEEGGKHPRMMPASSADAKAHEQDAAIAEALGPCWGAAQHTGGRNE